MRSNLRNIGLVSAVTMLSRVLGLARDILITGVFGTSALASAFVTAFTLPNLFRRLLGEGALTAALVPTLKDELTTGSRVGAFRVLNQVLSWLLAVTVLLVVGAMLGLSWFESHALKAAAGGDPTWARWALGARLAVWLFPYLALVCLAAAFSAALQTLHRFLEPALSPIWLNLAMIGALGGSIVFGWAQTGDARMAYLCGGVLVGGALQLAVPAWALWTEGWRPRWDVTLSGPLRGIGRLMGPTVLGSAIYLVNMAVARLLGLSLNESAAAVLNLAARLMELPIGVFAIAVTTVVFPVIAQHAAAGDRGALAAAYRQGLRLILLVNVPAAVGLAVLAEPIIRVLFQRGAFGAEDTALMMPVLVVFAAGLPFLAVVSLMLRGFYAHKDTVTPVRAAAWSFVINLVLSLTLMRVGGTVGLALASNLAVVFQAIYLQVHLSRRDDGLAFGAVRTDLLKLVVAATAMGGVVVAGRLGLQALWPATGLGREAGHLVVLVPVGVAVYAGAVWTLRVEGRDELGRIVRRKLGRTNPGETKP